MPLVQALPCNVTAVKRGDYYSSYKLSSPIPVVLIRGDIFLSQALFSEAILSASVVRLSVFQTPFVASFL